MTVGWARFCAHADTKPRGQTINLSAHPTLFSENKFTLVAALLVLDDGRYVMQLRDAIPRIFYPGHWGCFGGAVEAGEEPEQALRRELAEENDRDIRALPKVLAKKIHRQRQRPIRIRLAIRLAAMPCERMIGFGIFVEGHQRIG